MKNNELQKLFNYYLDGFLAHAYLISTNNVDKCFNELIFVIKKMYNDESFNKLIDNEEFPNLIVIKPDGKYIKKDDIKNLQSRFSRTSIFSDLKIYIILNAERMNKESCNSILKFLEEPTDNTIGFFITSDKYNIMSTILSRCELIDCRYESNSMIDLLNIEVDIYNEYMSFIKEYLYNIDACNNNILLNKEFLLKYNNRVDVINIFKIIFNIYLCIFNGNGYNDIKLDEFSFIKNQNKNIIYKKLELLKDILRNLNYNVNIQLLLDRFVIEMGEINHDSIHSNI